MILTSQRWFICAYEQVVPRDMDVFCVRQQIFLKMLFDLPTLDYLNVSIKIQRIYQRKQSKMVRRFFYESIGNYTNHNSEFLRIYAKNMSLLRIYVFAQIIQRLYYPKSLLGISAHVRKKTTSIEIWRI